MLSLKLNASPLYSLQNLQLRCRTQCDILICKPKRTFQNGPKNYCSMNMAANQSDNPRKISVGRFLDNARSVWNSTPKPVKSFPWNKTLDNFIQVILDLVVAVIKYLSVPLFVVTSISEMSYCAHEKKLYLILFPFMLGVAVTGTLRDAALESSPYLKNAEVPWHLIAVAIFFALLKFPGPYYPYWGRIFVPHFANGVLWRTLLFMFQWYHKASKNNQPHSTVVENPEASDGAYNG